MSLEKITFGKSLPGYLGGTKGRPGVIVLQEWWGITESVKKQAEHIAQQGDYRVLVPDLYKGKIGVTAEEGHHLMTNLNWPGAVGELREAISYLRKDGSPKVGAVGFCMGGALALLAAEHCGADTAISFYGTPDARMGTPKNVKVPVQAHSGTEDTFKGFADPATVKTWLGKVPVEHAFFEYPGEGHAFMNDDEEMVATMRKAGMSVGKPESQQAAWTRVFEFLKTHLGPSPSGGTATPATATTAATPSAGPPKPSNNDGVSSGCFGCFK